MAEAPAGGAGGAAGAKQDPQALIAKHAAVTQAGAQGDQAIVARVENAIKNSPMGWLQGVLGETGSRAASEQSQVSGKLAEHKDLVANQKDVPKDAGPPPAPGPAVHPAVPHPAAPAKAAVAAPAPAGGGAPEQHAPIAGAAVPKSAPAAAPAAAPAPTVASAVAGAGDSQIDGILNGYTPKGAQSTQTLGRIKSMGDIAQGFNGQLDRYIAQGGAVEHGIAATANFLGAGKDVSAVWATNPYRKVHGILGGIMTGMSAVKNVCGVVGSICGKLGMVLTVIGLLGMIFPPIGAAVSGIARILNVVGLICDSISFVLSGILTGLNGVVLAQQIAAGASAEEKAATADLMMSEANEAASGFVNLAMVFGPKFMKGLLGNSKGIVASLIKQAKATIGRISLKLSANVSHFANKIVRKLGFGGASFERVGGGWKDTGFLASTKEKWVGSKLGKAFTGAPQHLQVVQEKLMAKYGNTAWAKNMDRVGAWGGSVAHRLEKFDLGEQAGRMGEKSGSAIGGAFADTKIGKSMATAAERSELQTRELTMKMEARDAAHLEESRWKNQLDRRQAANPDHVREAGAEQKFVAGQGQKVRDEKLADFQSQERQREAKERLEQLRTERFERRNDEFYDNKTNGITGVGKRDEMMAGVHNTRERRYALEAEFKPQETERKELLAKTTKTAAEQERLTALNGELRKLDEARRVNKMYETDLSGLASGAERVRAPEYNNWKDVGSNAWEATAPALEMLHLKDQDSAWALAEKADLKKQTKYNKGTAQANAAGRGGHGTFADIAADARHRELDEMTEFVRAAPQTRTVTGSVRNMLSPIINRGAPAAAAPAAASAMEPQVAPTPSPTPAPVGPGPAHAPGGVTVAPTEHKEGDPVGASMQVAAQVHEPPVTAAAPVHEKKEEPAPDEAGGEALPYWPALIPEFDKATHDFGWMRKVAVEFKKAQIDGKQKAVDTLAVYGRYKEYAAARAAAAQKNTASAAQTGQATQQNVGHAAQTEGQAGQGEQKQGEAKGAANDKAATDLPEPESRGFWGRILGAVKRWAKNKAAQVFGWIQEKIASVILKGLCGVSMGDMREYAGALRRQQQAAHGVADGAGKTSGQAQQTSVKLSSDATKEAQGAADAIGECDKNIVDADQFMADIGSFEQQLAEEKANAQMFIASVHAAAEAERTKQQTEAAAHAAEEKKEQERAAQLGGGTGAPAATPSPTPVAADPAAAAPAPVAGEPAHEDNAQDISQIHAASQYVATEAESMTGKLEARADDYTNQLALALTNRTGKGADGVDLKGPAKKESKHIVEEFKEAAQHTKIDMEAFHNMSIDPSQSKRIAEQIITSAQHLEETYNHSENALDELFARTYNGIKDGRRTLKSRMLDGDNAVGAVNHAGDAVDNKTIDTALPTMNTAWDTVAKPIQVASAAPAPAAPSVTAAPAVQIARKEVDATPVPATNSALVTAAVGTSVAAGPTVIVDDASPQVTPGQLRKRDFLAKVEPALKAAASAELGMLWSVAACPYIQHYLTVYGARPAAELERFVRRYTGSKATDPDQLMLDLVSRVRIGVREWKATGKLPADVAAADPGVAAAANAGAASGAAAIQKKSASGGDGAEPATHVGKPDQVVQKLGEGAPLDSSTLSRMNDAFGTSFADVRVHADEQGAAAAREHNAHAFAVGTHVAFAPGKYDPGSPQGDALLAHELTHVMQQRGASSAPGGKEVSEPGDAHERDADAGARAAMGRLHDKSGASTDRPDVKTSSDLQLSRCESSLNEGESQMLGFHTGVYTWNGDPFVINLKIDTDKTKDHYRSLQFNVRYQGADDADGHDPSISLMLPINSTDKQIKPKITPDQPDGWLKLDVDVFGDASFVASFGHDVKLIDGWNPKSRKHTFHGKAGGQDAGPLHETVVKSKDAMPGTSTNVAGAPDQTDITPLRADIAALTTKKWLDEVLADRAYGLDAKQPPWAAIKAKVDADATKFTKPEDKDPAEATRLTRLSQVLEYAKPMLRALEVGTKKEAYPPDIADRAIAMVEGVRGQFSTAIGASWDGPADTQMVAAEKAFNTVWYRITSLYMEQGVGAQGMINNAVWAANEAKQMRIGHGRPPTVWTKLEGVLGIESSVVGPDGQPQKDPDSLAAKTEATYQQVRADFLAGKPGVLQRVTGIVQDSQLMLGVSAILATNEVFHRFKEEMAGLTGGAANTLGRDLGKVCDGYIGKFEGLAGGLDTQLKGGADLKTIGPTAVSSYQSIVASADFKKDVEAIQSRIKTVAVINTLAKVIAIVGVAALTGGVAGAAVGGALEGAGASAFVVGTGEFAAEVVTFTVASRIGNDVAFGKNEASFGEDLVTNALMFGFLKSAAAAYGRVFKVFADPRVYKVTYAVGGAVTGMVALQAFAEAHYRLKEGKWMDGDDRMRGVMSNAIMLAALSLGGFITKPLQARVKNEMLVFTAKNIPGRLELVEGKIAGIKAQVDALNLKDPANADHAADLLKKIESLWNEELAVLAEAAKAEKDNKAAAQRAFQETVDGYVKEIAKLDMQLASAGMEVDLGPNKAANLFKPVSPGFVAFRGEALEIVQDYYKQNGGTFKPIEGKDGLYQGSLKGEDTFFVRDDKEAQYFSKPADKPPTAQEVMKNKRLAEEARSQNAVRANEALLLLLKEISADGHCAHKFSRCINGTGLAAAMDANTLPTAQHGEKPAPITSLPSVIGIGSGPETFSKLGDTPIGQTAPELGGAGWAQGAQPGDFTTNHHDYTSASNLADAVQLTQYRTGTPVINAEVLECSLKRDATWKVDGAKVRLKIKITIPKEAGGPATREVFVYADATDIATGLGVPRELESDKINPDPDKAKQIRATLEKTGRLIFGDEAGNQRGGKVLVSGGSATGAWNAKIARALGGVVDWISEDRSPSRPPGSEAGKRTYKEIQDQLARGEITPEQANEQFAQARAFDAAMLPRNVDASDAAMKDTGITRGVKSIQSMVPAETDGGDPGKVKVTFSDGSVGEYDQVVISHSAEIGDPGAGRMKGAVGLAQGIELRPVVVDGQVVALESVDPPGAVRILGAAMWSRLWLAQIPDAAQSQIFRDALDNQARNAPRDSPVLPLIHNVGKQIPAANSQIK